MISKDFIMRLVEQLAKVLAKVLFLREQKKFSEAHKELDAVGTKITGLSWSLYKIMTAKSMVEWLSIGETFDSDKAVLIAELLTHEYDLLLDEGRESEGMTISINALELYAEIQRISPSEQNLNNAHKLLTTIENSGLSIENHKLGEIMEKLLRFA